MVTILSLDNDFGKERQTRQRWRDRQTETLSYLVGALSPVNHRGLHQGWAETEMEREKQRDSERNRLKTHKRFNRTIFNHTKKRKGVPQKSAFCLVLSA